MLVFFQPKSETTDLALAVADALHERYAGKLTVVPLAVWGAAKEDISAARDRRKLSVPVFDGAQAEAAYGVESVPRFVLVDGGGGVRWTFVWVGAETGPLAKSRVERLLPPASPAAPTGTAGPSAPPLAVVPARP
ncbi:MAG: hypothetical protein K2V38_04720 [Gemmataceae bacterium]|nr:hypothetical protein [Gemmataceae bacterium]